MDEVELTILIPCLNEEETIGIVVKKARNFLKKNRINGEVLVVDNNSTDASFSIARHNGARVIQEVTKGYGSALICGNKNANGKFIIMGDADDSYDFSSIMPFLEQLRNGDDLVVGNRFLNKMEKGAMPFTHRYIGNPFLSYVGRKLFKITIGDFHCGLRGYRKDQIIGLDLQAQGMDYASEMIIQAKLSNLKISEVPITLYRDKRVNCRSHINTINDGFRHLKLMFRIYRNSRGKI